MNKTGKLSIIATAILLTACVSAEKPVLPTNPTPVQTDVNPTEPPMPQAVSLPNPANRTKPRSRDKTSYAQRRVVQISAVKKARQGVLVDIQEGDIRGVHNITSRYGENHVVYVSRNYPTMILTPFAKPQVKDNVDKTNAGLEHFGSNVIVNPRNNRNIWLTIYDLANPRGLPVSLTLIPKAGLMSQTINVTVDRSPNEAVNGLQPAAGSFAQKLTNILKDIAMEKLPAGFTVRPLRENITLANGMQTMPVERYTSSEFDVYRYRIVNTGSERFEFDESSEEAFRSISKRVRAITPYPLTTLYPGESTDILILISKKGSDK